MEDFYYANDRVIGGLEKPMVMSAKERKTIAYHEAGHAVCGWFLEHAEPLLKVTIIPRGGGALGFAQYLPKELQLHTRDQLYDMMCMTLAGRAAEEVFFNKISTGAADDLNKVTRLAYGIEQIYGMGDSIGHLSYQPDSAQEAQMYRMHSEATAQLIDESCRKLVDQAYKRTLGIIRERKALVEALGDKLLDIEQLGHDELVQVLGPRPFQNDSYVNFLENTRDFSQKYGEEAVREKTVKDDRKKAQAAEETEAKASDDSEKSS
jgi:ATP-dependent Zn protease